MSAFTGPQARGPASRQRDEKRAAAALRAASVDLARRGGAPLPVPGVRRLAPHQQAREDNDMSTFIAPSEHLQLEKLLRISDQCQR